MIHAFIPLVTAYSWTAFPSPSCPGATLRRALPPTRHRCGEPHSNAAPHLPTLIYNHKLAYYALFVIVVSYTMQIIHMQICYECINLQAYHIHSIRWRLSWIRSGTSVPFAWWRRKVDSHRKGRAGPDSRLWGDAWALYIPKKISKSSQ